MKNTIFSISKILLSIATIPLWFLKMFVGVGHFPDQTTGEIVEVVFRHTMLENVGDWAHPIFAYIAMAIAAVSAVINAIAVKYSDNKRIKITANVTFGVAIGLFLILMLLASTVARGY
ncbi:MAG: hypothetical protein SOV58_05655 [Candidatus Enteromonas sp.]|nr:hypothetical protein [Candidatus Enteromonas sp.]